MSSVNKEAKIEYVDEAADALNLKLKINNNMNVYR